MRIVALLAVRDTREYEEQGDRWVPIPGSGDAHDCARCGRAHEVHAYVRLEDGTEVCVGTGCMRQLDMVREANRELRAIARRYRDDALRARLAAWNAAYAECAAVPMPEPLLEFEEHAPFRGAPPELLEVARIPETTIRVWCRGEGFTDERRRTLRDAWTDHLMHARGHGHRPWAPEPREGRERRSP